MASTQKTPRTSLPQRHCGSTRRDRVYALGISQCKPKGAAHARSGNSFRGGVSLRFTRRPKGQSTVEYVLIIAIIVLVVLIAGPWVSSAIRNQFNTVAGTLGNGISKGSWEPGGSGGGNGSLTDADIVDPVHGSAFAVYSEDDHSLMFYKRKGLPKVGDMFNNRRVTAVYTGFETASYDYDNSIPITDGLGNTCSTPWYSVKDGIRQAGVIDSGIKASSLRCWFANMLNVETVDISKLEPATPIDCTWTFINCRKMKSVFLPNGLTPSLMSDLFYACINLTSNGLSMPNFNMSSCTRSFAAFLSCYSLTTVSGIENWNVRNVRDFRDMFANCENLTADLSLWDVTSSSSGSDLPRNFNSDAPGVILPKVWQ